MLKLYVRELVKKKEEKKTEEEQETERVKNTTAMGSISAVVFEHMNGENIEK